MQKIVFFSYYHLTDKVKEVVKELNTSIPVEAIEVELGGAGELAEKLDADEDVAVIVSPKGHAEFIGELKQTPLVIVNVSDTDFLVALHKAAEVSNEVVIMRYGNIFEEFQPYDHLFNLTIHYDSYLSTAEAAEKVQQWVDKGVKTIIGTSVVYKEALKAGAHAVYLYSANTIREQIQQALEIVKSREHDQAKLRWIQAAISSTNQAVLSTDQEGKVTLANEQAFTLLGVEKSVVQNRDISEFFPVLEVESVLKKGHSVENLIIAERKLIANITPIKVEDRTIGSVFFLQEMSKVSDAESKIRKEMTKKGLVARYSFGHIIHQSETVQSVIKKAKIYARTDSSILILGETGTGKELFAQSIHNESPRKRQPFVAINCSALPEQLLESELFGYAEGAFTGAKKGGKRGLVELAHRGSIFLDEIGEISESLQARLLRVLQEKEIMRVGGEAVIPVDVRIISATNRDLRRMVDSRVFREDLYYRLNILDLILPPLRERSDDIPLLVQHFIMKSSPAFSEVLEEYPSILVMLKELPWKGNIRELENLVERMTVIYSHTKDVGMVEEVIELWRVSQNYQGEAGPVSQLESKKEQLEKDTILSVLNDVGGNKEKAAEKLGISRSTLWRKLQKM
ncbi:AAA family ATPase [Rossellomorea vietnamensis]|uniref:AAA family ATPase n=1 Tax=Rossellomorea vietnamensis TaxID=218284 RepID=A0A5D4LZQ3_9BACI|nr:sigma 54-interacting transcriptional regulator [Rossellomorea vietnamensis]TYR94851.1 AAA family ATPase [Rossellomorea vietnamensis]